MLKYFNLINNTLLLIININENVNISRTNNH